MVNTISFLAPSVQNNLPNELKRCTNLSTFKHKIKEYFLYKIIQKDNGIYLYDYFFSNFIVFVFIYVFIYLFIFDILPYLSLPIFLF